MMARKPRFCAYFRVSTQKQGKSGLGLDDQRQKALDHAQKHGGEISKDFTEVESGANNARPELARAIKYCRKTGATLLVASLSRLSRNVSFLMSLKDSGVKIAAADLPDSNTLTFTVMAGVAQYEREIIAKRTVDALAQSQNRRRELWEAAQAEYFPPPVRLLGGLRWNAPGVAEYQEQGMAKWKALANDAAEYAREDIEPLVREGASLRNIAAALNEIGTLTPRSRLLKSKHKLTDENQTYWSAQGVANAIARLGIEYPN